jgi:hypothetical protein
MVLEYIERFHSLYTKLLLLANLNVPMSVIFLRSASAEKTATMITKISLEWVLYKYAVSTISTQR